MRVRERGSGMGENGTSVSFGCVFVCVKHKILSLSHSHLFVTPFCYLHHSSFILSFLFFPSCFFLLPLQPVTVDSLAEKYKMEKRDAVMFVGWIQRAEFMMGKRAKYDPIFENSS